MRACCREEMQRGKEVEKAKDELRQERHRKKKAVEEFDREQMRKAEDERKEKQRMFEVRF